MNFSATSLANTLKDAGCQIFLNTLDKVDGAKDLVLSKTILAQLDSICSMQKLRQNAVDKVFILEQEGTRVSDTKNRVFVIRTSVDEVRRVCNEINTYINKDDNRPFNSADIKFWVMFVPRLVHYCDLILEEEGVYEYVSILECPLGLIPLEYDLYSLEDQTMFKKLFLLKDSTPLIDIVDSIVQLQILSGNITNIHGQGKFAEVVSKKLQESNLKRQNDKKSPNTFDEIYLFDRDIDYPSALLSQLNYEGILDETFELNCNKLEFEKTKHILTIETDPIFRYIRDSPFSTVFSLVKTKNLEMKQKYGKSEEMDIINLRNFVANDLKNLQNEKRCLALHISACEAIMKQRNVYDFGTQITIEKSIIEGVEMKETLEYITKLIDHKLHRLAPLRLLALLSVTQGGLLPKIYQSYHSSYCEKYGLDNNATFNNLRRLGLVTELPGGGLFKGAVSNFTSSILPRRGNFSVNLKKYNLSPELGPEGYDNLNPKDAAFPFGGIYIPLVSRLIELGISANVQTKSILVFFIGGVTFAEASALRFVAKQKNVKIAIGATSIMNGNKLIESLYPINRIHRD